MLAKFIIETQINPTDQTLLHKISQSVNPSARIQNFANLKCATAITNFRLLQQQTEEREQDSPT
jgi:hypothetical protein